MFSNTPAPPENWATTWASWIAWPALSEPAARPNSSRESTSSCGRVGVESKLTTGRDAGPETSTARGDVGARGLGDEVEFGIGGAGEG